MTERFDMEPATSPHAEVLGDVCRGLIYGLLAVAAAAIWAINLAGLFQQKIAIGWPMFLLRLLIIDAIPLAVLIVLFRAFTRKQTLEQVFLDVLRLMAWLVGYRPSNDPDPRFPKEF